MINISDVRMWTEKQLYIIHTKYVAHRNASQPINNCICVHLIKHNNYIQQIRIKTNIINSKNKKDKKK